MTKLMALVGTLARFAVFMARREAERDPTHRSDPRDSRDCMCDVCGWVRGIEADADDALEKWR